MLNKISFDSYKMKEIYPLKQIGMNYDVIGIDEIQFFDNILDTILDLVELLWINKELLISILFWNEILVLKDVLLLKYLPYQVLDSGSLGSSGLLL